MKITDADKNFAVKTNIEREGLAFHSVFEDAFSIHGVSYENGCFQGFNTFTTSEGPDEYGPSLEAFIRTQGWFCCIIAAVS